MEFTGPGATATTLSLAPNDTVMLAGQSYTLRPTAKDNNGQTVTNLALAWSVKDPTRGTVSGNGVFTALAGRGDTYVMGRLLSGPKDSAHIVVSLPPSKIALISGSSGGTVGQPIAQNIVVETRATDGLAVPFTPITISLTPKGAAASTMNVVTDASGRASIQMQLGPLAGSNVVQVSGIGVAPLTVTLEATPDKANNLKVVQAPAPNAASGALLVPQPSFRLTDVFGNDVAIANVPVSVKIKEPANGKTLSGTLTVNSDANGVAQFTDLRVSGTLATGSTATLAFAGLTTTIFSDVDLVVGAAAAMIAEGATSVAWPAGGSFDGSPSVRVVDDGGNGVPNADVHLEVRNVDSNAIASTDAKTDQQGRVLFSLLAIPNSAAAYTMVATSPLVPGVSRTVGLTVVNGAADHLRFRGEPTDGIAAGAAMTVSVDVLDRFENRATTGAGAAMPITLSLSGGTAGATLGPVNTANAVNGIATFSVAVSLAGVEYRLNAAGATGVTGATSISFSVAAGAASLVTRVSADGVGLVKNEETRVRVRVSDAGGTVIAGESVTFTVTSGAGLLSSGTAPVTLPTGANGEVEVDWNVGSAGVQSVRASIASGAFIDFRAFIAETLAVVREPAPTTQTGLVLAVQPSVQLRDLAGNPVKRAGIGVLVEARPDPPNQDVLTNLTGTVVSQTDANGVATWTDLTISGDLQTLRLAFSEVADPPVIQPTLSQIIDIRAGTAAFIFAQAGQSQQALVGTAVDVPPAVQVLDSQGGAVPGVAVEFKVDLGGGSITGASQITDRNGIATVGSWVMGPLEEPNTLIATADGTGITGNPVTFLANIQPIRNWTGARSTDWSDAGNWSPAQVPRNTDYAIIAPATNQPQLTAPSSALYVLIQGLGARLTINQQSLATTSLVTADSGVLVMTSPTDVVTTSSAAFQGGDEAGLLSAGELRVTSDFNTNGFRAFAASGTHRTVILGAGLHPVTMCCNAGDSYFNDLDISASEGINIQFSGNGVDVRGALISQVRDGAAPTLYGLGSALTASQLLVDKLIVDKAGVILNEGAIQKTQQFDNVTYQESVRNYYDKNPQLTIVASEGASGPRTLDFKNVIFVGLASPDVGPYVDVTSTGGTLIVNLFGADVKGAGNGPQFQRLTGNAIVNWKGQ